LGGIPYLPIVARRVHAIGNADVIDRSPMGAPAKKDNSRLAPLRESRPRLFHVDRQLADRFDLHAIDIALRTRLRCVELPPEIGLRFGKLRFLLDRLLAYNRLIPGEVVEDAPAIENHELAPAIGDPRGSDVIIVAQIGSEAAAALDRAGVKD